MVVASCASEREAENDLAGRVQRVLDDLVDVFQLVRSEPLGLGDETGRDDLSGVIPGRAVGGKDISGELLVEEAVIRDVGVERVDDVIAIEVRLGDGVIGVIPGGVGVAGEVEPVTTPALAVMGRGEQFVDQAFVGVGAVVGEERLDPLRSRRQADQVEGRRGGSAPGGWLGERVAVRNDDGQMR